MESRFLRSDLQKLQVNLGAVAFGRLSDNFLTAVGEHTLSISELGIGSAIVFSIYRPIAEGDNELLCALLNAYRKTYYVIGVVIAVAGLILFPLLPDLITGDVPANINLYILYLVYLFNTVISCFLFVYKQALFTAHQRSNLASKRSAAVYLASNVFQIVLLLT